MKDLIKWFLQKIIGYDAYLFLFGVFCVKRFGFGNYERGFAKFMDFIPSGGIIIDAGANLGVMSVLLAKRFPESTIFSFEPIPSNIKAFKRVVKNAQVRNIRLFETALGNFDGEIKMVLPVINKYKRHGLSHVWHAEDHSEWNRGIMQVSPIIKLDNLSALQSDQNITAIKIDVENYELEVLKGAAEIINKNRPLIYAELWDNENRIACIHFLTKLNYEIKVLEKDMLNDFTDQNAINFFFIPN